MLQQQRGTSRTVQCLQVEVELQGGRRRPARVRNISPEGMLLALESTEQQPGMKISISCQVNGREWHIPATVMHANPRGLGIRFNRPQPGLMRVATPLLSRQIQPIAGRFACT